MILCHLFWSWHYLDYDFLSTYRCFQVLRCFNLFFAWFLFIPTNHHPFGKEHDLPSFQTSRELWPPAVKKSSAAETIQKSNPGAHIWSDTFETVKV